MTEKHPSLIAVVRPSRIRWVFWSLVTCSAVVSTGISLAEDGLVSDAEPALPPSAASLRPLSASLPEGVLRIRAPFVFSAADEGFSKSGGLEEMGFELRRMAQVFAIEYGLVRGLSLTVTIPFVYQDELSFSGQKFRNSSYYEKASGTLLDRAADVLRDEEICGGRSSCKRLIRSGYVLPRDREFSLSDGESVLFRAGVPIASYIDSIVLNAVRPESGRTGLGDVEVGALYEAMALKEARTGELPLGLALALGLRLPTGAYEDVPRSQRPPGKGSVDLAVQILADYLLEPHTLFSLQLLGEWGLVDAERKPSRLTDSRVLLNGDPVPVRRNGPKTGGLVRLEYAVGGLLPAVDFLTLEGRFSTTREPASGQGGRALTSARSSESVWVGARLNGLKYAWPVVLGFLYEYPVSSSGEAALVAPRNLIGYGELYWNF
jgi:hypothetical protein